MNLEARKISLVQEFLRIDNEKIISALENVLHKIKSENFDKNLKPMSLNQFNEEIDKAIEDENKDRLINTKDLKDKIQKWD
jgi:CDP-glycerol glycerophosphotransferase (TagB/SpsB family)